MTRRIAILGATGSIGKSTLDLVERNPDRFTVCAVSAGTNVEALADIARRTRASLAVIADESCLTDLRELLAGTDCRAAAGDTGLGEAASGEADLVVRDSGVTDNQAGRAGGGISNIAQPGTGLWSRCRAR